MALNGSNNAEKIYNTLMEEYKNAFGVCALMGHLRAESGLNPKNLQNSFEKKLGYTDEEYTKAVDNGSYSNFVKDSAGYGLAQWTYWSRKKALLDHIKSSKLSIGDLEGQIRFLIIEIKGYKKVDNAIRTGKSLRSISDIILTEYEKPANQSESVKVLRASYGQSYYDMYANIPQKAPDNSVKYRVRTSWFDASSQIGAYSDIKNAKKTVDENPGYKVFDMNGKIVYDPTPEVFNSYLAKVTANVLKIRRGPGDNYEVVGKITDKGTYTIVKESAGKGSTKGWGKLKSNAGWISLDFVKKK